MRKFVIPIVAVTAALAIAAPASAQYRAPAYNYQPYDYGRGFEGHRFARQMNERVMRIRRDIRDMRDRRILSGREARSLEIEAANLQQRIYFASRNGIQPREARGLEEGIRRLEYRVHREATDFNNRPGGYRRY
jgi:hypothetical protein